MAVTYSSTVKDARMTVVKDAIDGSTAGGKLKIRDSGNTVLVTIVFDDPCGSVTANELVFSGLPNTAVASATGTADNAIITDSADVTVVSGLTVGTSGTNVILDALSITSGQTVSLNATSKISHGA